jgi:hypothetical protein
MTTKKLRAQKIILDMPREGHPVWANIVIQVCVKDDDYETIQVVDRRYQINRIFGDFAASMVTFTDPVTGQQITLSGAGVGQGISELVRGWMLAELPGAVVNDRNDIVQEGP